MKGAVAAIVVIAALFLAARIGWLAANGAVRADQGFCIEDGGYAEEAETREGAFFISPELAPRSTPVGFLNWPLCKDSRHVLHSELARPLGSDLLRLGEPVLAHVHVTLPSARILRVMTEPSYSRGPILYRLEFDRRGKASLISTWLEDSDPHALIEDRAIYARWRQAPLRRTSTFLSMPELDAQDLWNLANEARPSSRDRFQGVFDGDWLLIEQIDEGRRSVRAAPLGDRLSAPNRLFCALATAADTPLAVRLRGDVSDACHSAVGDPLPGYSGAEARVN